MKSLKNRYGNWALVTGASSGIGKEFAIQLANQKINLILTARRENLLNELREKLTNEYQIEISIITADLTKNKEVEILMQSLEKYDIGIFINNAGIGAPGMFVHNDLELIKNMIGLNVNAVALLSQYISNKIIKRKRGAIFIISSVVASIPIPYMTLYSATKAFDLAFGEALSFELDKYGINVCTVCPGSTETEFNGLRAKGLNKNVRTSEQVVETAIKSIGKKIVVTDGWMNKINTFLTRFFTRKFRINIAGKVAERILPQ